MRHILISAALLSGTLGSLSYAFAEEVEIHRDRPAGVVLPLPVPEHRDAVIEHRSSDCKTTTVHKENDMGDSKTVKKTNCD